MKQNSIEWSFEQRKSGELKVTIWDVNNNDPAMIKSNVWLQLIIKDIIYKKPAYILTIIFADYWLN